MKRILILNGSHSDIPLIRAAKELGLYVITTGNMPGLIGHKFADQYCAADYSDKDACLALARSLNIDYICSCANDAGQITASYVAEKMNLPGFDSYETTLKLHLKDRFKAYCEKNKNIPTAKTYDPSDSIAFPVIVKPVDMTGGKGITKVLRQEDLNQAVGHAMQVSRNQKIVIEEFIEGSQHSFSTFVVKKKVVAYFSDNEFSTVNPYTVSSSSYPASNHKEVEQSLVSITEDLCRDMNLKDGVVHHQYLFNEGTPYIIETTRRCSGDLYPYPVRNALKTDWAKWIVLASMGADLKDFPSVEQNGYGGRHCIQAERNGKIKEFRISDELKPFVTETIFTMHPGDSVTNYMSQKLAVLILKYPELRIMNDLTPRLHRLAIVEVD